MAEPRNPFSLVLGRRLLACVIAGTAPLLAQDKVDFVEHVRPILAKYCYECHGPDEQEADLRLDRKDAVFHSDETAWVVIPGKSDKSLLYERITLPSDDPDIMPAEGDPLSKEQIDLLKRWIDAGAEWPDSAAVDDVEPEKPIITVIELPERTDADKAAEDAALEALRGRNALAMRIADNSDAVDVNFSLLGDKATDADLEALRGLRKALVWVNLARTGITDAGLATLAENPLLQRIDLSRTAITDAGLAHLAGLGELRYLNLYGTKITDAGLAHLEKCTQLRKLFVWQTEVTDAGVAALQDAIANLHVDRGDYVDVIRKTAEEVAAKEKAKKEREAKNKPINKKCPITGKPVKAKFVSKYQDQVIGLCCEKCLAKFEADPAKFIGKVEEFKPAEEGAQAPAEAKGETAEKLAPINTVCPVSGEDVDPEKIVVYQGQAIGLCCGKCLAKFEADPAKFIGKVKEFKAPAKGKAKAGTAAKLAPINAVCPVSGEDVDPEKVAVYQGQAIGLCCGKCLAKFEADPAAFIGKVKEFKTK